LILFAKAILCYFEFYNNLDSITELDKDKLNESLYKLQL